MPSEAQVIGCEGDVPSQGPTSEVETVSYAEIRAKTGVGAIVLMDGTRVALDFAAGAMTVTIPGSLPQLVQASQLDDRTRGDFWALANLISRDPTFSFEAGSGPSPINGVSPAIRGHRYPLSDRDFGFPRARLKSDDEEDDSPCRGSRCSEPVVLPAVIVTTSLPSGGSFIGGGLWWRGTLPSVTPGTGLICPGDPAMCEFIDRQNFERWRQDRCDARIEYSVAAGAAALSIAAACTAGQVAPVAGQLGCVAAVVSYVYAMYQQGRAVRDCGSQYAPGWGG
jgi:hypothetical protein